MIPLLLIPDLALAASVVYTAVHPRMHAIYAVVNNLMGISLVIGPHTKTPKYPKLSVVPTIWEDPHTNAWGNIHIVGGEYIGQRHG
jgi:hypothetical protein